MGIWIRLSVRQKQPVCHYRNGFRFECWIRILGIYLNIRSCFCRGDSILLFDNVVSSIITSKNHSLINHQQIKVGIGENLFLWNNSIVYL